MSNSIGPLNPITPLLPLDQMNGMNKVGKSEGGDSFSGLLKDAITNLDKTQTEAEMAAFALATGQADDFHTPVIAMEKANLSLGLAVTVRNKVLNAYQEIMRMQI